MLSNLVLGLYGLVFLVGSIVTYAQGYDRATVIVVANRDILAVTSSAALLCAVTAAIGMAGVVLKSRKILAFHALLLWPCFALITAVGYLAYKGNRWNLKSRLGMQWRYDLSDADHAALQSTLHCCGFDNPSDHATYGERCWPESLLPGCQYKFFMFESDFLVKTYTITFAMVPLHVVIIIVSLLCSNHIDPLFGTRPPPPIPYLGQFLDWREWEQNQTGTAQHDDKPTSASAKVEAPESLRTRARKNYAIPNKEEEDSPDKIDTLAHKMYC
ncbi:hypothetical protein BCR43DRAFT_511706 [Syncephalastrum racemosum]|uniref:Tetraspanin family-domain-containing protein n=1 Tax=Syncephalastrum racemosum TaxID=13706 RepID=A0A1X2HN37_SYNRA|nr:hypothetical protein BCR43DRAFT_511706 [Syncephalastrum racemosum]